MNYSDIRFPHLGIVLSHVGRSISIGDFQIMYYGIIIACGFLLGLYVAQREAKRTGQSPDLYLDYLLYMMIPSIVGARAYYVIFSWDSYKDNLLEIFNTRHGGLGIVGGVMAAAIVLLIFSHFKKVKPALMLDTIVMGLLVGQIMGRWGNFFNREAFGGFTNGPLAMQIPVNYFTETGRLSEIQNSGVLDQAVGVMVNGQSVPYIQVHPTFLYEGLWNCLILLIIFLYRKHKKFDGELTCIYFMGYGIGRFFIEGLRTDQLILGHTGIAVTQIVSVLIFIFGAVWMIAGRKKNAKKS